MKNVTYCTKCWSGDYKDVIRYHPKADYYFGNNMTDKEQIEARKIYGKKFVYVGEGHPYTVSEKFAIEYCPTRYILWYAGDVKPPAKSWLNKAIELLEEYPIVSPFWSYPFGEYVKQKEKEGNPNGFEKTDFGYVDHSFSDHAYLSTTTFMRSIDYNADHPIKATYPAHGGNSFERQVGQYMAREGKKIAHLKNYQYRHTLSHEKN